MGCPDPLATANEIARYLRCDVEVVYELVKRHGLPALRLGRRLRFRWHDVGAWLSRDFTQKRERPAVQGEALEGTDDAGADPQSQS